MRPILILLLLLAADCDAQTFDRNYGRPFPNEEWTSARSQQEGDTLYTLYRRFRYNNFPILAQLVFQAEDVNGDTLFTRALLDGDDPHVPYGFEKVPSSNDLIGSGFRQTTDTTPDEIGGFLVRYDRMGDTLWYREYTSSDPYYNILQPTTINVDDQGNIAQIGYARHDTVIPWNHNPSDIYLMKADGQGNRLWDHTYGDPLLNETPVDLVKLPDGGYLVVGYTLINLPFPQPATFQSFLLRTDSMGNQVFLNYLPGIHSAGVSIAKLSDGDFLVSGELCTNAIDTCGGTLLKIDANANVIWQRYYPGSDPALGDEFWDAAELSDGSLIACGETSKQDTTQGWIMKTDADGNMLWQRFIDKTPGYDAFWHITSLSDGGILLTGQMQRDQLSDVWVVKIDSLGCDSAGCPTDMHAQVQEQPQGQGQLTAIPNPFSGSTLVAFAPTKSAGDLLVRDALGRVVQRLRVPSGSAGVDVALTSVPPGVLIATLSLAGQPVRSVRLLYEP